MKPLPGTNKISKQPEVQFRRFNGHSNAPNNPRPVNSRNYDQPHYKPPIRDLDLYLTLIGPEKTCELHQNLEPEIPIDEFKSRLGRGIEKLILEKLDLRKNYETEVAREIHNIPLEKAYLLGKFTELKPKNTPDSLWIEFYNWVKTEDSLELARGINDPEQAFYFICGLPLREKISLPATTEDIIQAGKLACAVNQGNDTAARRIFEKYINTVRAGDNKSLTLLFNVLQSLGAVEAAVAAIDHFNRVPYITDIEKYLPYINRYSHELKSIFSTGGEKAARSLINVLEENKWIVREGTSSALALDIAKKIPQSTEILLEKINRNANAWNRFLRRLGIGKLARLGKIYKSILAESTAANLFASLNNLISNNGIGEIPISFINQLMDRMKEDLPGDGFKQERTAVNIWNSYGKANHTLLKKLPLFLTLLQILENAKDFRDIIKASKLFRSGQLLNPGKLRYFEGYVLSAIVAALSPIVSISDYNYRLALEETVKADKNGSRLAHGLRVVANIIRPEFYENLFNAHRSAFFVAEKHSFYFLLRAKIKQHITFDHAEKFFDVLLCQEILGKALMQALKTHKFDQIDSALKQLKAALNKKNKIRPYENLEGFFRTKPGEAIKTKMIKVLISGQAA